MYLFVSRCFFAAISIANMLPAVRCRAKWIINTKKRNENAEFEKKNAKLFPWKHINRRIYCCIFYHHCWSLSKVFDFFAECIFSMECIQLYELSWFTLCCVGVRMRSMPSNWCQHFVFLHLPGHFGAVHLYSSVEHKRIVYIGTERIVVSFGVFYEPCHNSNNKKKINQKEKLIFLIFFRLKSILCYFVFTLDYSTICSLHSNAKANCLLQHIVNNFYSSIFSCNVCNLLATTFSVLW